MHFPLIPLPGFASDVSTVAFLHWFLPWFVMVLVGLHLRHYTRRWLFVESVTRSAEQMKVLRRELCKRWFTCIGIIGFFAIFSTYALAVVIISALVFLGLLAMGLSTMNPAVD